MIVQFIDEKTAQVRVQNGDVLVEEACVVLKKINGRWTRVLTGVVKMGTRYHRVEYCLGQASFQERIIMAAQSFLRSIIPEHFMFRLKMGSTLDIALAW